MSDIYDNSFGISHDHVFLGAAHEQNERKTWAVIALCTAMMLIEIIGGHLFGSLALMADGLHMSTHAGAMLMAALAYTYARKHRNDPRFIFGTGKLGDLAGYTSAIILAMIALLIGYEAIARLLSPVHIHFSEAIPIAVFGLLVNVASAWLLSGDDHHEHTHGHNHAHHEHDEHDMDDRDHNMRSTYIHVIADAAVSVLAIIALILAKTFNLQWMDPVAGIIGAFVIANWSYSLIRDTGTILVDASPNNAITNKVRTAIDASGDRLIDLHVWRLGPGHFGVIISVVTNELQRGPSFYHAALEKIQGLSHISVEVHIQLPSTTVLNTLPTAA